jgi:hypothetical protein
MANEPGGGGGARGPNAGKELPQHPLVESLRPDPSQPAKKTVVLIGLPGKSDRPGYQRLYLTTKLDYYAEFLVSSINSVPTLIEQIQLVRRFLREVLKGSVLKQA